ncbi:hypothetical protein CE91St44_15890 [Oscillospiraceae bacterium]|nr:hypothetical protein CE91St44_15890 [Oscillospiraceae bacterium]DAI92787.1 MAG TPA: hypothetical protein [Caudoviricetes sp.]
MKIIFQGDPKEIATLVFAVQERRNPTVNQLVLDAVNNAAGMQDGALWDTAMTDNSSEVVKDMAVKYGD